ncbi:IDEAL domain-containing protein [Staphylococcus chromogenes]|nr:IDEAL domain-containing protein [Staphylococcus chromogenes]MDQ7175216.1 IDEAL domain-containing protein [Staphylococcus chromogenes]
MRMIHQLAVEMVIEDALKIQRKQKLKQLIDEALCNKNEAQFKAYTEEFLQLEEHEIETLG